MLSLLLVALLGLTSATFKLSIDGTASKEALVVKGGKGKEMRFKKDDVMILKVHSSTLATLTNASFSYTYFPTTRVEHRTPRIQGLLRAQSLGIQLRICWSKCSRLVKLVWAIRMVPRSSRLHRLSRKRME